MQYSSRIHGARSLEIVRPGSTASQGWGRGRADYPRRGARRITQGQVRARRPVIKTADSLWAKGTPRPERSCGWCCTSL